MCQMTAIKEWKERNPGFEVDFITCFYLHWIAANHTDNFERIIFESDPNKMNLPGYDQTIEFKVDWGNAVNYGILRSWCETTLHFIPSTDKPYFLLTEEEKLTALHHYRAIMYNDYASETQNSPRYRKSVIFQPEAVSDPRRSFRGEDWARLIDLFPNDVAIIYFCPLERKFEKPITDKPNLIMLPGYPIGTSAAMMQLTDSIFTVHSATAMLAHAVDAKNIIHINFLEMSGKGILNVQNGEDVFFESNLNFNWDVIKEKIDKYLL